MSLSGPISVLIVDDVPLIRDAVKILLTQGDYAQIAGEADNGKSAVEIAENAKPDVILMDIDMPIMNGIEAAKAIRQKNQNVKIVMLTSSSQEQVIFDAFGAGADGYILKDKFRDTIHAAVITVRLGSVWLDPAIARRILEVAGGSNPVDGVLQPILTREEVETLNEVVTCTDGHCLVEPSFVKSLRRLAPNGNK